MSLRQIFNRMARIARSFSANDERISHDDLRYAQELIDEAANRWELPEQPREPPVQEEVNEDQRNDADERAGSAGDESMTYERAIAILEVKRGATSEEVPAARRPALERSWRCRASRRP